MKYIRTKDEIIDLKNTKECIYVIRDNSKESECRYVSYHWDNWKNYYLIDYQNCVLFSYNSAQNFISDLMKENLKYQNLVIELSPYYKDYNQSDTIAELCDEFVVASNTPFVKMNPKIQKNMEFEEISQSYVKSKKKSIVYGAIWTDKGLIYVAKMNEKGELVLI